MKTSFFSFPAEKCERGKKTTKKIASIPLRFLIKKLFLLLTDFSFRYSSWRIKEIKVERKVFNMHAHVNSITSIFCFLQRENIVNSRKKNIKKLWTKENIETLKKNIEASKMFSVKQCEMYKCFHIMIFISQAMTRILN